MTPEHQKLRKKYQSYIKDHIEKHLSEFTNNKFESIEFYLDRKINLEDILGNDSNLQKQVVDALNGHIALENTFLDIVIEKFKVPISLEKFKSFLNNGNLDFIKYNDGDDWDDIQDGNDYDTSTWYNGENAGWFSGYHHIYSQVIPSIVVAHKDFIWRIKGLRFDRYYGTILLLKNDRVIDKIETIIKYTPILVFTDIKRELKRKNIIYKEAWKETRLGGKKIWEKYAGEDPPPRDGDYKFSQYIGF